MIRLFGRLSRQEKLEVKASMMLSPTGYPNYSQQYNKDILNTVHLTKAFVSLAYHLH